jgi:hypothetical protein
VRLNHALAPFGIKEAELPYDYTLFVFAVLAAVISFSVVKTQIKFAYYLYFFSQQEEQKLPEPTNEAEQMVIEKVKAKQLRLRRMLTVLLYTNFLMPILIIILFVNPLCKDMVVPTYVSADTFLIIRVFFIILACFLRGLTMREEL